MKRVHPSWYFVAGWIVGALFAFTVPAHAADAVNTGAYNTRYVPSDLTFMATGEPVLIIHADGRITASKRAKPDEAARAILKALEGMLRERECKK